MSDFRGEQYFKPSFRAYSTVQKMPVEIVMEKKKLARLLEDDGWWLELSDADHRLVGKFIARFDSQLRDLCHDYGLETPYAFVRDGKGSGEFVSEGDSIDEMVYHYTSLHSCLEIIKSESLYLMNSDYMNDAKERRYFSEVFEGFVKAEIAGAPMLESKLSAFMLDLSNLCHEPTFLTSFSIKGDDAAQWERYADYGEGVCIGFDNNILKKVQSKCSGLLFEKVKYGNTFGKRKIIIDLLDYLKNGGTANDRTKLLNSLYRESIIRKHASFDSEQECRFLTSSYYRTSINNEIIQFEAGSAMKEAWELKWNDVLGKDAVQLSDIIKLIRIGPKCSYKEELLDKHLRKGFGMTTNIIKSDSPLR